MPVLPQAACCNAADLEWRLPNWLSASRRQLFWLAVRLRSKVVPLMVSQYRLARWCYGTKGLKSLGAGTAGRGMSRTIANIY